MSRVSLPSGVDASRTSLPGFNEVACKGHYNPTYEDLREIVQANIPYERPASFDVACSFATDRHRPAALELKGVATRYVARAPLPGALGWRGRARVYLRPHPRIETILTAELENSAIPGRFVSQDGTDILFANLSELTGSLSLRQQLVFTRNLTLEAYLQLFLAYERYGTYYSADASAGSVRLADLLPASVQATRPDFTEASLRANLALRWEYSPRSVLFLVYSRTSDDQVFPAGSGTVQLNPYLFGHGPATDTLLLKWSIFFIG